MQSLSYHLNLLPRQHILKAPPEYCGYGTHDFDQILSLTSSLETLLDRWSLKINKPTFHPSPRPRGGLVPPFYPPDIYVIPLPRKPTDPSHSESIIKDNVHCL